MHGQMPVIWERAENFKGYDPYGNVFIDFTSTMFVANEGHANKRITEALKKQLEKPLLHTYTYASQERIDYLEYLITNTPKQFEKAFLLSAGTEATEAVLKLMRLNGQIYSQNQVLNLPDRLQSITTDLHCGILNGLTGTQRRVVRNGI